MAKPSSSQTWCRLDGRSASHLPATCSSNKKFVGNQIHIIISCSCCTLATCIWDDMGSVLCVYKPIIAELYSNSGFIYYCICIYLENSSGYYIKRFLHIHLIVFVYTYISYEHFRLLPFHVDFPVDTPHTALCVINAYSYSSFVQTPHLKIYVGGNNSWIPFFSQIAVSLRVKRR